MYFHYATYVGYFINLAILSAYCFVACRLRFKFAHVIVLVLLLPIVYVAHVASSILYWEMLLWLAVNETEQTMAVTGDGGNIIVHIVIIGPAYTLLVGILGGSIFACRTATLE